MGGNTRKPVVVTPVKPRLPDSPTPKNVLLPHQIDEAMFGKRKPKKNTVIK